MGGERVELPIGKTNTPLRKEFPHAPSVCLSLSLHRHTLLSRSHIIKPRFDESNKGYICSKAPKHNKKFKQAFTNTRKGFECFNNLTSLDQDCLLYIELLT